MARETTDVVMMKMALLTSSRTTCVRNAVGCILTNNLGHVIATGYNGVARGMPHCLDEQCSGANAPSGTRLDECKAIHAEANALLQCKDVQSIHSCYVTHFPCIHCTKLLMNTSCYQIFYLNDYANGGYSLWPHLTTKIVLPQNS